MTTETFAISTVRPKTLGTSLLATCPNSSEELWLLYSDALNTISSRDIDQYVKLTLIVCYTVIIVIGAMGNGLTCFVVARKARMRTPLNLLIVNLAASDLVLCVITQPLNVIKFSRLHWIFGEIMCKAVPLLQGTNVFRIDNNNIGHRLLSLRSYRLPDNQLAFER